MGSNFWILQKRLNWYRVRSIASLRLWNSRKLRWRLSSKKWWLKKGSKKNCSKRLNKNGYKRENWDMTIISSAISLRAPWVIPKNPFRKSRSRRNHKLVMLKSYILDLSFLHQKTEVRGLDLPLINQSMRKFKFYPQRHWGYKKMRIMVA